MTNITKIKLNGVEYPIEDSTKQPLLTFDDVPTSGSTNPVKSSGIYAHTSDTSNPHSVTKAQVGLGNTVDGAQINVIEEVQKNGTPLTIVNKSVNLTLSKTDVGLGNIDNTSDLNKPISTATQTALDGKVSVSQGIEYAGKYLAVGDDGDVTLVNGGGSGDIVTISAVSGANGSISPSGDVRVITGEDKAFTFTPNTGYGVDYVTIDGVNVGRMNSYTFTNVRSAHTISVAFRVLPVYTVIRYKNQSATTVDVRANVQSIDLSTQGVRENIVKGFARHCLVTRNIESKTYVNENNFEIDLEGNAVVLTGADGDFVMEFDTLWWTCTDKSTYWEIKFATFQFDENAVTPHRFGGTVRSHRYLGVFNGYNDTWLRSIATSNVPSNAQNIDWFSNQAKAGGAGMSTNTYGIENMLDWMMLIILHMFVYKTTDMQSIVRGLNQGSGSSASALLGCNSGFSATGGWTQGTTENYTTCCMTLGIMNVYGKQWQFIGNCIFNGGNWKFATDPADYYAVASGSYSGAPAAWTVVAAGTPTNMSQSYIKEICGNNVAPFLPTAVGGSSSTYFCDAAWSSTGDRCCFVGATVAAASGVAGLFAVLVNYAVSHSNWNIGARLAFSSLD